MSLTSAPASGIAASNALPSGVFVGVSVFVEVSVPSGVGGIGISRAAWVPDTPENWRETMPLMVA